MKRVASILLAVVCLLGIPVQSGAVPVQENRAVLPFSDVQPGSWYYDAVAYVYGMGLMSGETPTSFGPNNNIKRKDYVVMLGRLYENIKATTISSGITNPFTDVQDRGQYYYKYIGWAYQNGIVSGESPTSFGINSAITRQDCCKILNNFAKKFYQIYNRVSVSTFSDDA